MCQEGEGEHLTGGSSHHPPLAMASAALSSSAETSSSMDPFEALEEHSFHNRSPGAIPTLSLLPPKDREYFLLTFLLMFTILIVMFIAWRVKR